jgi:uncharacterized protein (DUF362 family)/ferredoxin
MDAMPANGERVAVVRCADYAPRRVEESVAEAFRLLGGLARYIRPGMRVILKPNLLAGRAPEGAVTTHPVVVGAVARQVADLGAHPIIADSPSGSFSVPELRSVYRTTGMESLAGETGASLSYDLGVVERQIPSGATIKRARLVNALLSADLVINLPKLKTHGLTLLTGAVKNMFGAVPGREKAEYHLRMPDPSDFSGMLVDVWAEISPSLTLMDGIVGMEGNGPGGGDPRRLDLLIAGRSAVAVDMVMSAVVDLPHREVPTTHRAIMRGLGPGRLDEIDLVGARLDEVKVRSFALPCGRPMAEFLPNLAKAVLKRYLRPKPVLAPERCDGCGACLEACAAGAIALHNGIPHTDLGECIRCFCCQEMCPRGAISIHRPRFAGYVYR